nr:hypothetical protein [Tanacetum cinerariifolium]
GTAVGKEGEKKKEAEVKVEVAPEAVAVQAEVAPQEKPVEAKQEEDVVMGEDDEEVEAITWEEYDFTKPTGCDHATCGGCKTDGIWSG